MQALVLMLGILHLVVAGEAPPLLRGRRHLTWALFNSGSGVTKPVASPSTARPRMASLDTLPGAATGGQPGGGEGVVEGTPPQTGQGCGANTRVSKASVSLGWVTRRSRGRHRYMHMASVAQMASGELVVAWQAAARTEGTADQAIYYAVSKDGGTRWGSPVKLGLPQTGARWAPVLFQPRSGPLHLFYADGKSCHWGGRRDWRAGGDIKLVTTADLKRWSRPRTLLAEAAEGLVPKVVSNPPVELDVGGTTHWVFPFWRQRPRKEAVCKVGGKDSSGVLVGTAGQGETPVSWKAYGELNIPRRFGMPNPNMGSRLIEGTVALLKGGKILQMFRTTHNLIFSSTSSDGGKTWSSPSPTALPCPNSKLNMIRLTTGELLLGYNAHKPAQRQRGLLYVAISADDGKKWRVLAKLEPRLAPSTMYSYPTLTQVGCDVVVVYSYLRFGAAADGGIKSARIRLTYTRRSPL